MPLFRVTLYRQPDNTKIYETVSDLALSVGIRVGGYYEDTLAIIVDGMNDCYLADPTQEFTIKISPVSLVKE